jgi:hypothetical protein
MLVVFERFLFWTDENYLRIPLENHQSIHNPKNQQSPKILSSIQEITAISS